MCTDCDRYYDNHGCGAGLVCGYNNCAKYHKIGQQTGIREGSDCCERKLDKLVCEGVCGWTLLLRWIVGRRFVFGFIFCFTTACTPRQCDSMPISLKSLPKLHADILRTAPFVFRQPLDRTHRDIQVPCSCETCNNRRCV